MSAANASPETTPDAGGAPDPAPAPQQATAPPTAPLHSVAWLHVRAGRLLSVRTRGRDVFYLPGGKYEAGESAPEALSRELSEELGLVVDPADLVERFTIHDVAHGQNGRPLRMTCFEGGPEDVSPVVGREIAEYAWLGPADRARCAPAGRQAIERLVAEGLLAVAD
ncbi:NUDIX domain-containing protein [Streptomyces sp. NPDC059740]|uniref:NUDIX hydrolase n=1 Tax=Streptomyces sp. NPDC059740 TaxID=3346926 RepID=UPI00365A354A